MSNYCGPIPILNVLHALPHLTLEKYPTKISEISAVVISN